MLSDEDKKRIEAEEAYREQVRKGLKPQLSEDVSATAGKSEKKKGKIGTGTGCLVILAVMFAVFVLPVFMSSFSSSRNAATQRAEQTRIATLPKSVVSFTSDPTGATVTVDGSRKGVTPLDVEVLEEQEFSYKVTAEEPYEDYNLYKVFSGKMTPTEDAAVNVWLERTTVEEQEAQKQATETRKANEALAACKRRMANSPLVVESWGWTKSSNYAIVEGKVTNQSGATLENILAVAEFKTGDGTFITSDDSLLEYNTLLPGQSTPFKIYANFNPAMERANLGFKQMFGGAVGYISRDEACG